jgi:glycosyltransferase involved in cell wall biosynthesis
VRVAIVGNFGLGYKATMSARAVPIAAELDRLGHRTTIFVPDDRPAGSRSRPAAEVPVVAAGAVRSSFAPLRVAEHAALGLRLTVRAWRSRPDVLYAFKPKGYAGLALAVFWALKRLGWRETILALDTDDWEGRGGWADYERRPPWLAALVSWHERWCLRHADVVTVASRELEKLAERDVLCVPNAASPASPGWREGDRARGRAAIGLGDVPLILAYTRFFEFGPARLIRVFERVRARVPEARLVVVGTGLGNEDAELAALARARGLESAIRHLGWRPVAELPDLFAAADVAVYPLDDTLLNRAKCPMKLVDLLLAGVPVVADAVGQAREYVEDDRTGRLVPAGDVEAMADAVAALLRDPPRARAMGQNARRAIAERWSWADQARRIAEAFERASSAPRP